MTERLEDIAIALVAAGKGILAADESSGTIKKRFDAINLVSTEETRRDYREMLFRANEAMKSYISGVILYDETIRQKAKDGTPLVEIIRNAGAVPGIKVDAGAKPLAGFEGETVTEGLDGLRERLNEYYALGARFAKWRAVISISDGLPTWGAVKQNAQALARYAALCQEANIVPIVEPEVLMDGKPGNHTIDRCYGVTEWVLKTVFTELYDARVRLEGMILKPNMVIDGRNDRKASVEEVAEKTVRCFRNTVPAAVPGIAFLSGGQTGEEATARYPHECCFDMPWKMTFSYGRALQAAALEAWGGKEEISQPGSGLSRIAQG
jgi:fructose-bisphosphate aldolase class I